MKKNYIAQWIENNHTEGHAYAFKSKHKAIQFAQAALRSRLTINGLGVWHVFLNAETQENIVAHGSMIVRNNGRIHYSTTK